MAVSLSVDAFVTCLQPLIELQWGKRLCERRRRGGLAVPRQSGAGFKREQLSIWPACGPCWHGDGWGSEGFLMLSQQEDGNLQTTPLFALH